MFNINYANVAIKTIAETMAINIAKQLPKKALTKGSIYPLVKLIASRLGFYMTKEVFTKGVVKIVPIIGGVTNGGLTYISFRTCSTRLKNKFKALPISDPNYYKSLLNEQ